MSVNWRELEFFRPSEFDYPHKIGAQIVKLVNELRKRCGIPLKITSDFRTDAEMIVIYGPGRSRWVDSPHQRGTALDIQPMPNTPINRLVVIGEVYRMWKLGMWPRLGLEAATRHIHVDCDDKLKRPHFWIGKSR